MVLSVDLSAPVVGATDEFAVALQEYDDVRQRQSEAAPALAALYEDVAGLHMGRIATLFSYAAAPVPQPALAA